MKQRSTSGPQEACGSNGDRIAEISIKSNKITIDDCTLATSGISPYTIWMY
jgi:hypothetical protein